MSCLTQQERAVWSARLVEAEQAYHDLMMGGQVKTVVDQNNERIEYSTGSPQRLLTYIAYLKAKLGLTARGPLNVWIA